MEKEKAALEISIQKEKQELSQLISTKAEIKSVEQIPTGKTMLGGKITVDEEDYKKVTATMESELKELRKYKELAEKTLSEHGLSDYFRKAFIYSNNRDL